MPQIGEGGTIQRQLPVANVDYRLLAHFQASRDRYEAARRALPQRWVTDPRPEMQYLNELWVNMIARAGEDRDPTLKSFG